MTTDSSPFDEDFRRRLEVVRVAARRLIREGRWRLLRERRRGPGQEFSDHRDYVPGDEIRHIDWSVYARLDRPKVRVHEETEPPALTVLLDASASMRGAAFDGARRLAAALAHVGLCHLGPVHVAPFGESSRPMLGPLRGEGAFAGVLGFLGQVRAEGPTGIGGAIRRSDRGRRGVTVLISDLLSEEAWVPGLRRRRGHRWLIVHLEPPLPAVEGEAILRDRETGESIRRTITPGILESHRRVRESAAQMIQSAAGQRGAGYLRVAAGTPFDETAIAVLREIACDTPSF